MRRGVWRGKLAPVGARPGSGGAGGGRAGPPPGWGPPPVGAGPALAFAFLLPPLGSLAARNPAAERTFGYPRAAVMGRRMAEVIIPPPLRERHHRAMAHYLATGEGPILGRLLELTALRADGSEFPIELTINVMRLADETPIFTGYLRDITERKRAEEERVRLLAAEQAARRGAEASERRLAFLAEASAVLASSLEWQATLEQVARLALPVLAHYFLINLVEGGTRMRPVAAAHAD